MEIYTQKQICFSAAIIPMQLSPTLLIGRAISACMKTGSRRVTLTEESQNWSAENESKHPVNSLHSKIVWKMSVAWFWQNGQFGLSKICFFIRFHLVGRLSRQRRQANTLTLFSTSSFHNLRHNLQSISTLELSPTVLLRSLCFKARYPLLTLYSPYLSGTQMR